VSGSTRGKHHERPMLGKGYLLGNIGERARRNPHEHAVRREHGIDNCILRRWRAGSRILHIVGISGTKCRERTHRRRSAAVGSGQG
jgi:hypothetical protein